MPAPDTSWAKEIPYLRELDRAALERARVRVSQRAYRRGETIFLEGEPCHGLYVVKAGRVRVFKTSAEGKEQTLHVLGPGQSFNDVAVFDGGPNPANTVALEPTSLFVIPREDLHALIRQQPAVALAVLRIFAGRVRHLTRLVEDLSFRTVKNRLARVLLGMVDGSAPAVSGRRRTGGLTQSELAAMVGTAREMIGRALKSLEADGALRMERGRIVLTDVAALRRAAE